MATNWKQTIGGYITLAGLCLMAGAAGWWWLTRGGVIDRAELFSQTRVTVSESDRFTHAIGFGGDVEGAWELGPYHLEPEDSPISITGSFNAVGAQAKRKPAFTLKAALVTENGTEVWTGEREIRHANRRSDADVSGAELMLGMAPIHREGEYTLYANTNEGMGRSGVGTGAMELDLVIRRDAKPFPFVPVIVGFVLFVGASFIFGKRVERPHR